MKKAIASVYTSVILFGISINAWAQSSGSDIEMADIMRAEGKIYVVVGVIALIFIGIVLYLISIERRLKKIEKEQRQ